MQTTQDAGPCYILHPQCPRDNLLPLIHFDPEFISTLMNVIDNAKSDADYVESPLTACTCPAAAAEGDPGQTGL